MTTTYKLPEGATSVAANGQTFHADEHGHIDVTPAFPGTVAALVAHAGIVPVKSAEDLAREVEEAAERTRFDAEVRAMLAQLNRSAAACVAAAQAEADLKGAAATAEQEAGLAERALREAAVASAPVQEVEPSAPIEDAPAEILVGVIPPKRRKA